MYYNVCSSECIASSTIDSSVHQAQMHPKDNVLQMQEWSRNRDDVAYDDIAYNNNIA